MQTLNASQKTKKTAAGRIPVDWEAVNLGKYLKEISIRNSPINTNLPVLSVTNSQGFVSSESYFDRKVYSKDLSNYKIIEKEQFAYNPSRINVGSISQLKSFDKGLLSPMYVVFEAQEGLEADYLAYWIQSGRFNNLVDANTQGTVRDSVNYTALASFPFARPPIDEQKKIITILSSVDKTLNKFESVIIETQQIKKALTQDLFTRGLPGKHKKYKKTKIGEIPEEWEVRRLNDFCLKITDGEHLTPKYCEDGKILLSAKDIREDDVSFDSPRYVSAEDFNKFRSRCDPQVGDVLVVSRGATIGRICFLETDDIFSLMGSVIQIRTDEKFLSGMYLSKFLKTSYAQMELIKTSGSSAQQAIYLVHIKNFKIAVPSLAEQKIITMHLDGIDSFIEKTIFETNQLKLLKSALMQALLTGEIRAHSL